MGLAVGLTAALLIMYYVSNQTSYDAWLKNSDRIYRLDTVESYPGRTPLEIARAPGPVSQVLMDQITGVRAISRAYTSDIKVEVGGQRIIEEALAVDDNFLKLIKLDVLTSQSDISQSDISQSDISQSDIMLTRPDSLVLTEKAAKKYFGANVSYDDIVGQQLTLHRLQPRGYIVRAIIQDIPENSHFHFDMLVPIEGFFSSEEERNILNFWGGAYFHTYFELAEGYRLSDIVSLFPDLIDRNIPDNLASLLSVAPHDFFQFKPVNITDIHLQGAPLASMKPVGDVTALVTLSVVALLIMIIAAFNFSILATSKATLRAKEVALRKTLGARVSQVITQFSLETFLHAGVAGLIALVLSEILIPLIEGNLGPVFGENPYEDGWFLIWFTGFVVLNAMVAGAYPAFILSRMRPSSILSPDRQTISDGNRVRVFMVSVQVWITAILISIGTLMYLQQNFIRGFDLGFDSDRLWVIKLPETDNQKAAATQFLTRLKSLPAIEGAAISSAVPGDQSEDNLAINLPGEGKPAIFGFHDVSEGFFEAFSVKPISGRTFVGALSQLGGEDSQPIVINTSALKRMGMNNPDEAVGKTITSGGNNAYHIMGVVPDIRFRSLKDQVRPEVFRLRANPGDNIVVKITNDLLHADIEQIGDIFHSLYGNSPLDINAMSVYLESLYAIQSRNTALIFMAAFLAVLLSAIGLFATFHYTVIRKRKELAIRRVFGADSMRLLILLARRFAKPIIVANCISWPFSFYLISIWLDSFVERVSVGPVPFLGALLLSLCISGFLLISHITIVRNTRPINILRRD
jgi:putative ABC transport system permease protein